MKRLWIASVTILALGWLLVAPAAFALDKLIWSKGGQGKEEEIPGRVIKDDYGAVTIVAGPGLQTKKYRREIRRVVYGDADNRSLDTALQSYQDGNYDVALKQLDAASKSSMLRLQDAQKPLFGQYILYYRAMCHYRKGESADKLEERRQQWKAAQELFDSLLQRVPDTAFYFDAKLNQARCLEAFSPKQAKERYAALAGDFKDKIEKGGSGLRFAQKYSFLASMGKIRLDMYEKVKKEGNEGAVESLLREMKSFQSGKVYERYADAATRTEATNIEAMALTYLKKYKELLSIMDKQIGVSQANDDAEALATQYVRRGDALFNLAGSEAGAAAKRGYQERALMDYLRADLVFRLPNSEKGPVNLRVAQLFIALRGTDWKKRAKKHLKIAKKFGAADVRAVEEAFEQAVMQ